MLKNRFKHLPVTDNTSSHDRLDDPRYAALCIIAEIQSGMPPARIGIQFEGYYEHCSAAESYLIRRALNELQGLGGVDPTTWLKLDLLARTGKIQQQAQMQLTPAG